VFAAERESQEFVLSPSLQRLVEQRRPTASVRAIADGEGRPVGTHSDPRLTIGQRKGMECVKRPASWSISIRDRDGASWDRGELWRAQRSSRRGPGAMTSPSRSWPMARARAS
jgi:hypothetical protein